MTSTISKSGFIAGFWAGLPFIAVGFPFSVFFGIVATEAGLSVAQAMGFTIVVIAGASQFTAVQLMIEAVPVWSVLAAALAVNLRMAMYSASLQPHIGAAPLWQRMLCAYINFDASYAISIARYDQDPPMSVNEKVGYFLGSISLMTPLWFLGTYIGAVFGETFLGGFDVTFAMPILFLALVAPMIKTLAHLAAAVTSIVATLALSLMPSGTGLLIAALLAMIIGAEIERRRGR
ncbi:MAG: branched-chain amino acid ABC transporter permease [Boseongicola sp.]|nr:AzlC family ABC transporter permease [Boseongicola sp.]NNL19565.1 branched-chain amino acid ABC transporter permease [Boseongicola sp.]